MVQSGVPHLVPARCNSKNESRKTSITRSPPYHPSTKISIKETQGFRFLDLAVLWGSPVRGRPQLRRNVGRPPIGAALQSKGFPQLTGNPLFSEYLAPFPGSPPWCEERPPRQRVVEFDDLAELGLSRNYQKIPRRKCA